jgi:tRNA 2-thiouridine synthesizing protein E
MYDINKYLASPLLDQKDPYGYIHEAERWSPRLASLIAVEEGIVLEDEHWEVIYSLRECFRELGPEWTARDITRRLEMNFADSGGKRHLYQLFPHGPLAQGCRIAGLPLPQGTKSLSFGSVH